MIEFEVPHRLRAFVRARESSLILLAAVVGALAGVVVTLMGSGVDLLHSLFFGLPFGQRLSALVSLDPVLAMLVPTLGGLVLGVAYTFIAAWRPAREVDPIEANALHGGRMSSYINALTGAGGFHRWIHTDGRDFPANMTENPQFNGYSIGRWIDEDGDGRYDTLIVETRGIKGPRAFESTGTVLHEDNQTIVRERIYLDKADPNLLHDEIITIDHALTHPWTIIKDYRRAPNNGPIWWIESVCTENNEHVTISDEIYFLSADGLLMPSKKDQPPPDLRYFKSRK